MDHEMDPYENNSHGIAKKGTLSAKNGGSYSQLHQANVIYLSLSMQQ